MLSFDLNEPRGFQHALTCPNCDGTMELVQNMDGALFVCEKCRDEIPAIDIETITE